MIAPEDDDAGDLEDGGVDLVGVLGSRKCFSHGWRLNRGTDDRSDFHPSERGRSGANCHGAYTGTSLPRVVTDRRRRSCRVLRHACDWGVGFWRHQDPQQGVHEKLTAWNQQQQHQEKQPGRPRLQT